MKLSLVDKMVSSRYIVIDKEKFRACDVEEVLEALSDTEGFMNTIVIHNERLMLCLERNGILKATIRGGCYRGDNYDVGSKEIIAVIYGEESMKIFGTSFGIQSYNLGDNLFVIFEDEIPERPKEDFKEWIAGKAITSYAGRNCIFLSDWDRFMKAWLDNQDAFTE